MTGQEQQDVNTLIRAAIALTEVARRDWTIVSEPPFDGQSQAFVEEWVSTIAAAVERLSGEEVGEDY